MVMPDHDEHIAIETQIAELKYEIKALQDWAFGPDGRHGAARLIDDTNEAVKRWEAAKSRAMWIVGTSMLLGWAAAAWVGLRFIGTHLAGGGR